MDMTDIMEMAIKAGAVEQVSKLAGIDAKEAAPAIEVVLPLLIKGMQSQAKSKDTKEGFLKALEADFEVEQKGKEPYRPAALHEFSMYLGGKWYSLKAREGRYDDADPIGVLDVTILSGLVLDKLLGIKDLRTDKRIDFVGGIRGLGELASRVDSGEMKVAFALYPVSMKQLTDIADSGNIMPPKTTWFEPKLRSGLAIHKLD